MNEYVIQSVLTMSKQRPSLADIAARGYSLDVKNRDQAERRSPAP